MSVAPTHGARPLFGRVDVAVVSVTLAAGAIALLAGWVGVSGTARQADQWPWLNLALGGMVVSGVGIALWLIEGSRRVKGSRQALLVGLTGGGPADPLLSAVATSGPAATSVTAARMTRYHRPDCTLMAGKPAEPVTETRAGQLRPCGMCHPEREDGR